MNNKQAYTEAVVLYNRREANLNAYKDFVLRYYKPPYNAEILRTITRYVTELNRLEHIILDYERLNKIPVSALKKDAEEF